MQPYRNPITEESPAIFDHDWNDIGTVWASDEIRMALESGDLQRAADLAEQMSDTDFCIFD